MWLALLAIAIAMLVGSWIYLAHRSTTQAIDDDTLCLKRAEPPVAALVMVDVTDRIAPANITMIEDTVVQAAERLPRASRVILVPFGDDTTSAFVPAYSHCTAARGGDARLDENARMLDVAQKRFVSELRATVRRAISEAPTSHTSPITQQVVRAASSPTLGWEGARRRLILVSDGLETGEFVRRKVVLPKPDKSILDDVDVTFVEVGNRRDRLLQSRQVRDAWQRWFEASGASSTTMIAPGYSARQP